MKFSEYQERAWSTAIYDNKGDNLVYVAEGLYGESGEVSELIKRTHRKEGVDVDRLTEELGDVLWYICGICSELRIEIEEVTRSISTTELYDYRYPLLTFINKDRATVKLGVSVGKVLEYADSILYTGNNARGGLKASLGDCLYYAKHIGAIFSITLTQIAQANLDKLASRQERGVLRGTGGNR